MCDNLLIICSIDVVTFMNKEFTIRRMHIFFSNICVSWFNLKISCQFWVLLNRDSVGEARGAITVTIALRKRFIDDKLLYFYL